MPTPCVSNARSAATAASYFDYEPTEAEAQLIKGMITEKLREEYGQTPQEFCEDVGGIEIGGMTGVTQYIYPQNLKATANLWLWSLRTFDFGGSRTVVSVLAHDAAAHLYADRSCFMLRFFNDPHGRYHRTLDFMRYAVRYLISTQQYFEWR